MKKILIANRGEIAVRIIRTCKEMGIHTVAIYSIGADEKALHVKMADEAYCIGAAPSKESYLNVSNIISTAKHAKVDAIHPGYGFLSENADFAKICVENGFIYVGPDCEAIRKMGDKAEAKETMKKAGVPTVPGTDGVIKDEKTAVCIAKEIGYPVIVKASAGGGGKGMRVVRSEEELKASIRKAQKEAEASFGNPEVYLEKYLENTRHVEIQIVGDKYGNVIYLGERDCSIQRRHQKLLEEAPSLALSEDLRKKMGRAAVLAAKAVNYSGAGTVEFLLNESGEFYFMEMNTRIQVEHPVTELVTGIDLIKEQINAAFGNEISFKQEDIKINGCALECRINAENPRENFMPCPGEIKRYFPPSGFGVRVDSAAYSGYKITPFYDSMIAKVITWGRNRKEAIERMKRALDEFDIEGIDTTIPFHKSLLKNEVFISGNFNTDFLEKNKII